MILVVLLAFISLILWAVSGRHPGQGHGFLGVDGVSEREEGPRRAGCAMPHRAQDNGSWSGSERIERSRMAVPRVVEAHGPGTDAA